MDSSANSEVQALFLAAMERPAAEQAAFVREHAAGDLELQADVLSLLQAGKASTGYFDGLARRLGRADRAPNSGPLEEGQRLGPYRVVRLIGRGGMGAVYLGERADRQFDKQVALKVLAGGFASQGARDRFRVERQILAQLEHPNLGHLLDGGLTEDGAPYFVMDYVEGQPIDEWCEARQLTARARVRLFLQVCDALQYAHQNLVVHRDIKPTNILVTDDGQVRLLDFGIAKLLDSGEAGGELTRAGERPMTLAYASPEMIRGEPVTIAMDVYALGVLLYRLLVGVFPYPIEGCDDHEIMRIVCEEDTLTASRRASRPPYGTRGAQHGALARDLRGDLDAILSKALRKEPAQRYAFVQSLADDLRRYLNEEPVLARAPSLGYRMKKLVRRHRLPVALGTAAAFLLVVTAVLALWFAVTTSRQAEVIARESERAEEIKDFVLSIFDVADPHESRGDTITARELLDQGTERLREKLDSQPETQADMLQVVGGIYMVLGLYDRAWPLMEEVKALRERLGGAHSADYANALDALAELAEVRGEYQLAMRLAQETVEIREELADDVGLARGVTRLGRIRHLLGHLEEAERLYREGLGLFRKTLGEVAPEVAQGISHLGALLAHLDRFEESEALHRQSLQIADELFPDGHLMVAGFHINLADTLRHLERHDEALEQLAEALRVNHELLGPDHRDNAYVYNNRSVVYQDLGRYDEAEADLRRGLEILRDCFHEGHPSVGVTLANLGKVLIDQGQEDEGLDCLSRSLDILFTEIPDHWMVSEIRLQLGECAFRRSDFEEAERLTAEALLDYEERWGEDDYRTQHIFEVLADIHTAWGNPGEAARYRARLSSF